MGIIGSHRAEEKKKEVDEENEKELEVGVVGCWEVQRFVKLE